VTETAALYGPVAADVPLVGARLRDLANGHHPLLGEALAYVFDTSGKYIRPALVMLSGKLGAYERDRLVTLAASLEVVHTATLVHDDTIDEALTRRGLATVNAVWDSRVAILIGDFLFAQSAYLAAQLDSVRIMSLLSETVMAMSSGELRQYASSRDRVIDEADYFSRIGGKTASLFAMCCEGAAIVSRQPEDQVSALRQYGTNLGLAFQIADDVLDFASDEQTLGKPAGSDLRQGTITLPVILLAQRLDQDSSLLRDLREGRNLDAVIDAVRASEVLQLALQRAQEYARAARSALSVFPDNEAKASLLNLTEHVITRQR
jgi:geranylgeranyl pyrophosphate synthase